MLTTQIPGETGGIVPALYSVQHRGHLRWGRQTPICRLAEVVAPPLREEHRTTGSSEDRKVQDEHDHLCSAIERRGHDVIVLREPAWVARAHPPLREDAERH